MANDYDKNADALTNWQAAKRAYDAFNEASTTQPLALISGDLLILDKRVKETEAALLKVDPLKLWYIEDTSAVNVRPDGETRLYPITGDFILKARKTRK